MTFPDNTPHMDIPQPHLPHDPTKTELIEKYWYAFLKDRKKELIKRRTSGFGVPKVDVDENTFWSWFLENRLEDGE